MKTALNSLSVYEEIVTHATLNLMTKLTDYPQSPAQKEAKIEAKRRNERRPKRDKACCRFQQRANQ